MGFILVIANYFMRDLLHGGSQASQLPLDSFQLLPEFDDVGFVLLRLLLDLKDLFDVVAELFPHGSGRAHFGKGAL